VGARKLEIALYRVDGSVDRTSIGTSRPNRDNPKLMKLFEEKLGELDPGFGVELMILSAPEVESWSGALDSLPETATFANPLGEDGTIDLADRLALRLGAENVVRLAPRDSHLPERVQTTAPISTPSMPGAWARVASMKGARPTRLLQRPEPVEVIALLPDDPPRQFQWRRHAHKVVKIEGPERLADEWWRPRPNGRVMPANIIRRCATITESRTTMAAASGCSATARSTPPSGSCTGFAHEQMPTQFSLCHPERSEGSSASASVLWIRREVLRCAQDDRGPPVIFPLF